MEEPLFEKLNGAWVSLIVAMVLITALFALKSCKEAQVQQACLEKTGSPKCVHGLEVDEADVPKEVVK